MKPKIIISGGNGFIGKNLIELLSKDFRIYNLVRSKKKKLKN